MPSIHPIFTAILSAFIVAIVINDCLVDKVFKKTRFSLSCVNLFVLLIACALYSKFILPSDTLSLILFIYSLLVYGVFALLLYISFSDSMTKANHYNMLMNTIKTTRFNVYLIVDRKDRIKEISEGLLEETGLTLDDVIGKNFFDTFERCVRFTKFNGADINNRDIREYYKTYKSQAKEKQEDKREMVMSNYDGKNVVINVIEHPVFVFGHYRGRVWMGEKKSDLTLLQAEKELNEKKEELEGIRYKFVGALELTKEMMFFIDLQDRYIWINDNYKNCLNLPGNTLSLDDFRNLMADGDSYKYSDKIAELTVKNPTYTFKYRIKKGDSYIWVNERGKRLFDDASSSIILGFVEEIKTNAFEKLGIPEIDNCLSDDDLLEDVKKLYKQHRTFELLAIRIKNIPELNEKYGRSMGNMIMGEYIKKILQSLKTESSCLYRLTGIEYVLTITDPGKMVLLKKIFEVESSPLDLRLVYGSLDVTVEARAGIALSNEDAENAETLISCAKQALRFASTDGYSKSCCYYRDVR